MIRAYVSVGSNIAPDANVPAALAALMDRAEVTGVSTMYRTAPLNRPEQDPFANGVWRISTDVEPRPLKFEVLRPIEQSLGRVRTDDAYAARTIDLDVLLYGDLVLDEDGLEIPDPDILRRPFLAVPLVELEPELCLPGSGVALALHPVCGQTAGMVPLSDLTRRLKEMADL